jgi:hypothetical protein
MAPDNQTSMNTEQREIVELQRELLALSLEKWLSKLGRRCAPLWHDSDKLDRLLHEWLGRIPHCRLLYAMDPHGIQISGNVAPESIDRRLLGQDLGDRPYLSQTPFVDGFALSDVYISTENRRPCITAVHSVYRNDAVIGHVAADFDLRDLPMLQTTVQQGKGWRQIQGDPAIRTQLFAQGRVPSLMDGCLGDVLATMNELICERGVFHGKLHFSSSRATLWLMDDPYRYRIHVMEEIVDPSICLAYSRRPYPTGAMVPPEAVRPVLDALAALRFMDEHLYLRSGSLNVMNGLVGLNFSCDGSHYMVFDEFLEHDVNFWLGQPTLAAIG